MPNVTLKDVARAAGASTASASRALAGRVRVAPDLRTRIIAAASRLGYRPNLAARALASRRSGLVGLVPPDGEDGLLAGIVRGAELALDAHGYGVLLAGEREGGPGTAGARLAAKGVEGLVFVGRQPAGAERQELGGRGLPWVAAVEGAGDERCIDLGRTRAAELACRYLLELGHRRLGLLVVAGRLSAVALSDRLQAAGASIQWTVAPSGGPDDIRNAIQGLLEASARPTALVCSDDLAALAAVRECATRGLAIPGALAIVGLGDEPFSRHAYPALTTVRMSPGEVGTQVAEGLIDALAGQPLRSRTGAVKLVVRETTPRLPG